MERVMTNKANWLVQHDYDVSIVTTDQRGREHYFALDERIKTYDLGINYDLTNGSLVYKIITYPFKQWKHQKRLSCFLKKKKADVVICMFNNDVSFVHKIHDGSRKILESHFGKNKKIQYGRHGLWSLFDRWRTYKEEQIVRHYDSFVVLTHEDAELWGNLSNIHVIPNARPFSSSHPTDINQKRVLAIGRYDYQKGFDILIDIWNRIQWYNAPMAHDWQLNIVGDGPLRNDLQEKIDRLGLSDSVHLLYPTSEIYSLYLQSSIFVLTSRFEGLPMVLLEAQACGLPIVAFACQCGPRDIIQNNINGYLIENINDKEFAQCLSNLMQDKSIRKNMSDAARKSSEIFDEECIMRKWEFLIHSMIDK